MSTYYKLIIFPIRSETSEENNGEKYSLFYTVLLWPEKIINGEETFVALTDAVAAELNNDLSLVRAPNLKTWMCRKPFSKARVMKVLEMIDSFQPRSCFLLIENNLQDVVLKTIVIVVCLPWTENMLFKKEYHPQGMNYALMTVRFIEIMCTFLL